MRKRPREVIYEIRNFQAGKTRIDSKKILSDISRQLTAARSREPVPLHFLA